jgi:hypothetical protein
MGGDPIHDGLVLFAEFMGTGARPETDAKSLRRWVHAHQKLLDPALDRPLNDWLQRVREAEDSRAAAALGAYVQLRRRCRDYGTDAAFDRQAWAEQNRDTDELMSQLRAEAARAQDTYSRTRTAFDAGEAAGLWVACSEAASKVDAPWQIRADFIISLSVMFLEMYRVTGNESYSEDALSFLRKIVDVLPRTSGLRLNCLINITVGWQDRFRADPALPVLDRALAAHEEVASDYAGTGRTDATVAVALGDRCRCRWTRYQLTNSMTDLRAAGRAQAAWLTLKPSIRPQDTAWQAELVAALARHGFRPG